MDIAPSIDPLDPWRFWIDAAVQIYYRWRYGACWPWYYTHWEINQEFLP
jgi:hypothetical protein